MIAFIHLGKTAGSTFKNVLRRSFGYHHCDAVAADKVRFTDSDLKLAQRVYPGLWSLCSHHLYDSVHTLSTPLDYVTFLRDPAERSASHYQHMISDLDKGRRSSVPELEEWLSGSARNFQIRQISGGEDVDTALNIINDKFLFVGLTEQYEISLNTFAALSPWPVNTHIEKRNISAQTSTKKKLLDDPSIRKLIEAATEADRVLYEKVHSTIFPAQLEEARQLTAGKLHRNPPDRYQAGRYYTNIIYRPAVKLNRKFISQG
jgi:hypothetical protein